MNNTQLTEELTIHIPIGDWQLEALRTETPITNRDDVLKAVESGVQTAQIARRVIVWREMGLTPSDFMRPNKLLLHAGAREDIARMVRAAQHTVKVKDRSYRAPDYVGPVQTPEPEDDGNGQTFQTTIPDDQPTTYVKHSDPAAAKLAEDYLLRIVGGHIWPRLLTIYESGGNVPDIVKQLKKQLDEMVLRLK